MKKLILVFKGYDVWDRPVYACDGRLYVDVNPCKGQIPEIWTKLNNEFEGEPDCPIGDDVDILFAPSRVTWSH